MQKKWNIYLAIVWCLMLIAVISIIIDAYDIYKIRSAYANLKAKANRILSNKESEECISNACPPSSCKNSEDWTNAYYKVFGKDTACAVAMYKAQSHILKGKVLPPRHNKCYFREDFEFLSQEGLNYKDFMNACMNDKLPPVKPSRHFLIPKKLNFVWFTSKKDFKYNKNVFHKTSPYIMHNATITPNWQHTLWVNDKSLIQPSIKAELISKNIKLKSIDELPIKDQKHIKLRELAKLYASKNKWGMATDIARDLVEYYEGGVYVDGDYKILDVPSLENYMQSYKSFFGIVNLSEHVKKPFFEVTNAFIASAPKGRIIAKKIDLNYRNMLTILKAPLYVQYPCSFFHLTILRTGPIAMSVAFFQAKSAEDALIPYCYLFQVPGSLKCINIDKWGTHDFSASWNDKTKLYAY